MPTDLRIALNLDLALTRVSRDIRRGYTFFKHPHELALVDVDRGGWLGSLRSELPNYVPGDLYLCNAPKPRGAVRPGGILSLRDQVVYAALVGYLSDQIRVALDWGDEIVDFSHPLSPHPDDPHWFENYFPLWRRFAQESIARARDWAQYVVLADVTAYYECIDLGLLTSDLRAIGANTAVLELLARCLNKWSQAAVSGRGLPQGFSASDILARFYLNRVDRNLRDRGINHLRYVDDIRIFAPDLPTAKRHFVELIILLRKRGLAVQTSKSQVMPAVAAVEKIQGMLPALQAVLQDFVSSVAHLFGADNEYFTVAHAEELLEENPDNAPVELIREAYRRYLLPPTQYAFDKTLYHFLVRRLARAEDDFGLAHSLTLLKDQPQETSEVLRYIAKLGRVADCDAAVLAHMSSSDAIYPHQLFEILSWRLEQPPAPPDAMVAFVRTLLRDRPIAPYLRTICREFLGRYGTPGDLDQLHDTLLTITADLERAELICCLRRVETARRNALLARYGNAGLYTDRAIRAVRTGVFPGA